MKTARHLTLTLLIALIALLTLACGGDNSPSGSNQPRERDSDTPASPGETRTSSLLPNASNNPQNTGATPGSPDATRPKPDSTITFMLERTAEPREDGPTPPPGQNTPAAEGTPTTETTSSSSTTVPRPLPTPTRPAAPVDLELSLAQMLDINPKTTDQVLLQDIYQHADMDLDQFALDPAMKEKVHLNRDLEPYPSFHTYNYGQVFELSQFLGHPYLFLIPGLQYKFQHGRYQSSGAEYHPRLDHNREFGPTFWAPSPVSYFIYHPWFEEINIKEDYTRQPAGLILASNVDRWDFLSKFGPFWFGSNSTRGVLLKSVSQMFEDTLQPNAEPVAIPWQVPPDTFADLDFDNTDFEPTNFPTENVKWKLSDFLSTTINFRNYKGERGDDNDNANFEDNYKSPNIKWRFLHPSLPVIKVTSENVRSFPYGLDGYQWTSPTRYEISFVISFQNRWTSFDDPNRWVRRFGEDISKAENNYSFMYPLPRLEQSTTYPHSLSAATKAIHDSSPFDPNQEWHHTDYMQHRIIGPVVLTITDSQVFQEGTYSITPKVTEWAAPGYIATDKQLLNTVEYWKPNPEFDPDKPENGPRSIPDEPDTFFSLTPSYFRRPNANLPLPGHVLTTPRNGPGTEHWKERNMDANNW